MLNFRFFGVLVISFVTLTNAQNLCYRCFGSNWCNNFTHPDFINNVHFDDCPATSSKAFEYDGDNPAIARVLKNFEEASNRVQKDVVARSGSGCVTATLHEAHEVHTIRTCLNDAAIICPAVRRVILNPTINDIEPGVYLDCEGCTDSLCNSQTFIQPEEDTTTTTTTSTTQAPPITKTTTTETSAIPTITSTTSSDTPPPVANSTTTEAPPTSSSTTEAPPVNSNTTGSPPTDPDHPPPSPTKAAANVALVSFVPVILAIIATVCVF